MGTDWLKFIDPALAIAGGLAGGNPLNIAGGLMGLAGAAFPSLGSNITGMLTSLGTDLGLGVPGLFDPSNMGFSGPNQYLPTSIQNALGLGSGSNTPAALPPSSNLSVNPGDVFNAFNGVATPQAQGPATSAGGMQTGAVSTNQSPVNMSALGKLYLSYLMSKRLQQRSAPGFGVPSAQQPPFNPFVGTPGPGMIAPPQVQL